MKYAQIDLSTGVVVSVSYLAGEVDLPHMLPLTDEDDVQPGDIRNADGTWTRPEPVPIVPGPSEIDLLGQQLVERELAELELQNTQTLLGQQIVDIDLRLLQGGL